MTARLTTAEARALGIDPTGASSAARARSTRRGRSATGDQVAICHDCGQTFHGETAAARHNAETHHARFELAP